MDYQAANFYLNIVLYVLIFIQWLYVWRSNKDKATKTQIDNQALQLAAFEQRLKNAIGHPELAPLYTRINGVDSKLSKIEGQMKTLDLIHELLLKGDK